MRLIFFILFLFAVSAAYSQTKKIAFKSHSGNLNEFRFALEESSDLENSNFGMAIQPEVRNARLDTLYLLTDTSAIMVTSEYCYQRRDPNKKETKWSAGKDTVYRHPYFNATLSTDSIREILKHYYFNQVEKTIIVRYVNEPDLITQKKRESTPLFTGNDQDYNPFDGNMMLMTGLVFGISLVGGLIAFSLKLFRPE
jgi:hypothetical protein